MARKNQVWATLEEDIYAEVEAMAEREQRKMTDMIAILVKLAVKERNRKHKKSKNDAKEENQQ